MESCKLLLVDDEEEFAATLAERLTLRGIQVTVAANGEDALLRLAEDEPDIIILDLMMPGMSGLSALKRIREAHPRVHVILVSGVGGVENGMNGMKIGAFDYLMKPVEIETLLKTIEEALMKRPREVT
jgi:DNA-binding response OmpR family regulator